MMPGLMTKSQLRYLNLKQRVVALYGGKCKYCGENRHELLQLDHIYGGGGDARQNKSSTGKIGNTTLYYRALREKDRAKYQILCKRCNMAKHNDTEEDFWKWIQQVIAYNPTLVLKGSQ